MKTITQIVLAAGVLAGLSSFVTLNADASEITLKTVQASFDDVRQDLGDAVVNRGFKIDYEAYVGDMLERTAEDVGASKKIYNKAEFIQFCSATLSRAAMEADPLNIAFCPYTLFVYERADEPGNIHVGFRRLDEAGSDAAKAAHAKINAVLDEIVNEAIQQ